MKNILQKMIMWAKVHKILTLIILLAVAGSVYGATKIFGNNTAETRYVVAIAERGTIVSSISGTGQVSASNQIDLKAKTSGDLVYLNAKAGQSVKNGVLLGQLDAGDAEFELENTRLAYEELVTVDPSEKRDAENALDEAKNNLEDSYADARAKLATSFTNMVDTMASLNELMNGYLSSSSHSNLSKTARNYLDRNEEQWYATDDLLDDFSKKYLTVTSDTIDEEIELLLAEENTIATQVANAAKYSKDAVVYLRNQEDEDNTEADDAYTTVNELLTTANNTVSDTLSAKNTITDGRRAFENAEDDLKEIEDGPDALDVREQELAVRQKEDAYADYFIRAPFAGIIASVDAHKGDALNSGDTIATLITKQKMAEISLNEIDAAKIEIGQKATLTFDALENLTISGQVIEADLVGTVSSGVVNYTIKIGFDTDDEKVKPGMTVTANIITDMKQDVITVPAGAVKTQGDVSYVEIVKGDISATQELQAGVLLSYSPERVEVETGISNDESVEIISGISEGDQYVARTIITSTASTVSQTPSLFPTSGRGTGSTKR